MRITALTIENFKGISEPVRIEFKPITLLFGPNSAGKSTVIQALHYMREILERNNVDPDKCIGADESIDLGGFENLVHNHDLERCIRLKCEVQSDDIEFPEYKAVLKEGPSYRTEIVNYWGTSANTIWVEIEVKWNEVLKRPLVSNYATGFNGHQFARITRNEDGERIKLAFLNLQHPELGSYFISLCDEIMKGKNNTKDIPGEYILEGLDSVIPKWGKSLTLSSDYYDEAYYLAEEEDEQTEGNKQYERVRQHYESIAEFEGTYLSPLIVGPGEVLLNLLKIGRYIGPIRKIPPRGYAPVRYEDESRWASGLAAWDLLYKADASLLSDTYYWLLDRLNTGYSVYMRRYKKLDTTGDLYRSLVGKGSKWDASMGQLIEQLPEERQLVLFDERRGLEILPQDVGIGISQILPVVVASLDEGTGILMVEQPELHIHPGLQVSLADLFISQIQDASKTFIIETHSEHLLLRLLRRIRETNDDQLPEGIDGLTPEQLSINYIDWFDGGLRVKRLEVSPDGDSLGPWPKGFFEERAGELF